MIDDDACTTDPRTVFPQSICGTPNCDDAVIGSVVLHDGFIVNQYTDVDRRYGIFNSYPEPHCYRDLEDFDRLHVKIPAIIKQFESVSIIAKLCPLGNDPSNNPSVNIFPAARDSLEYLTSCDVAAEQVRTNMLATIGIDWINIGTRELLKNQNIVSPVIYEGKSEGKGELCLRVKLGEIVLAEASLTMELREASDFVELYRVSFAHGSGSNDTSNVLISDTCAKIGVTADTPWNCGTNIALFVHGWNVCQSEKDAWRDMIFKRLFWTGYRGRFAAFQWPTLDGFTGGIADILFDARNFDNSEYRAWQSSKSLKSLIDGELSGCGRKLTVLAHSMGNIVAANALNERQSTNGINYVALQGAVSAQYFDGATAGSSPLEGRTWSDELMNWVLSPVEFGTPDILGHYWTGTSASPPYFDALFSGEAHVRFFNFFNRHDYALNSWVTDQRMKPDSAGYGFDYTGGLGEYKNDDTSYFYSVGPLGFGRVRLSVDVELERWKIFSYAAQSYSLALGQVTMPRFNGNYDLNSKAGYGDQHYYHSFEFRANLLDTMIFWCKVQEIIETGEIGDD